MSQWMMTSQL
jgi:hypothetical protein